MLPQPVSDPFEDAKAELHNLDSFELIASWINDNFQTLADRSGFTGKFEGVSFAAMRFTDHLLLKSHYTKFSGPGFHGGMKFTSDLYPRDACPFRQIGIHFGVGHFGVHHREICMFAKDWEKLAFMTKMRGEIT